MTEDSLRKMINAIDVDMPTEGEEAPALEGMKPLPKKTRSNKKFFVQKQVTEVYIYTDFNNKTIGEQVFSQLYLLGEMSEAKLRRIVNADRERHEEG